jgi:UDP-N-acetylmuramoylalanine--D-glutamate ligase
MKVAVIGYGKQGKAAVEYWGKENEITVCDSNESLELPDGISKQTGKDYLADLDQFDLIVRSPIIHPNSLIAAAGPEIVKKVTTVTEEFMKVCPAPIIGVTGTKGKGTTSSLITKILEAADYKVHLGGNIGIAPLEMLKNNIQPSDWVVLELANFQLIDLHYSPQIAVCLMITAEHLDWHPDMEEYVASKQNIFSHQDADNLAIFNRRNEFSIELASASPGLKRSYEVAPVGEEPQQITGAYVQGESIYMDGEKVCDVTDVALLGHHNLENVCAAIAATWDLIDHNTDAVKEAVSGFHGLVHRIELIRELSGVQYYDDSFATTPASSIVALQALPQPKVIILGGSEKNAEYRELAEAVKANNVRTVVQIGVTGPKISEALRAVGFENIKDGGSSIEQIVVTAQKAAQPGDAVLFSPACASFDMFKNYIERGEKFHAAVDSLA